MKLFATILLFISVSAFGNNIYYDPNNGTAGTGTQLNPYRSMATVISTMAKGDSVFFAQGTTTYAGSTATGGFFLSIGTKDTIYIGSFYNGISTAKPIWTGLKTIATASLVSKGGNYYGYTDSDFTTYLSEFVMDGKPMKMMRNEASASNPYHPFQFTNGTSYIVDTALTGSEGYGGYELVYRGINWNITRVKCTSQSGDTLRFAAQDGQKGSIGYVAQKGWGYFIQGKPGTAETAGEWYYNASTKEVVFYLPDGNPSAHTFQVPIRSIAVNSSANGVTFDGIDFRGFYMEAYTGGGDYTKFKNCNFSLMGVAAIYVTDRLGLEFWYSNFYDNQNDGIKGTSTNSISLGCNYWKVIGCTFYRHGIVSEGMGYGNGDPMFVACLVTGSYATLQDNTLDSAGYNGYHLQGVGELVERNYGANTNYYLADGGVFYNFYGTSKPASPPQSIAQDNTFLHAIGNSHGVNPGTFNPGNDNNKAANFYLDENSANWLVQRNNFGYAAWGNLMLNGTHDIAMRNNNCFKAWRALVIADFDTNLANAANTNRFVSNTVSQDTYSANFPASPTNMFLDFHNLYGRTPANVLYSDSNKFFTFYPLTNKLFYMQMLSSWSNKTIAEWKTYIGSELNSSFAQTGSHSFYTNATADTVYVSLSGTWQKVDGSGVSGSIAVPPYGSVILLNQTEGKAAQTINFPALPNKTYGDAVFYLTANASSSLPVTYTSGNTSVATVSGNTVTVIGAGTTNITASQPGNGSYNAATSVAQALTVLKANQTISFATIPNKQEGDVPFSVSATATSGLTVSFSVASGPATISGSTVTLTGAGTVVISATQAGNGNINAATTVQQSFAVTALPPVMLNQAITFPAIANKTIGAPPFALAATASSGLTVAYNVVSGPATIAGSTVTITGTGTVVIQATQAGNGTYNPAAPVSASFTVSEIKGVKYLTTNGRFLVNEARILVTPINQ